MCACVCEMFYACICYMSVEDNSSSGKQEPNFKQLMWYKNVYAINIHIRTHMHI